MVPPPGRSCIRGHWPSTGAAAAADAGVGPDVAGLGAPACPDAAGLGAAACPEVADLVGTAGYAAAASRAGAGAARLNATSVATERYTGMSRVIVLILRRWSSKGKQQGVCRSEAVTVRHGNAVAS